MMKRISRLLALTLVLAACLSLEGCIFAVGAAAGGAAGYEAHKHGYRVQAPLKKDDAGGYKAQSPVKKDQNGDQNSDQKTSG